MIADTINNKKLNSIKTEKFIKGKKMYLVFITQSYFKVLKDVRLNYTQFFIMKIPNKRELQQIALIKIYKKCTVEPSSFLINDATLASDNPLRFTIIFLICNKIMTSDDQIRDKKLQYDINKKAAEVSALSSGRIEKYEYLAGEEITI